MCGDTECPSCGTAQGTYSDGQADAFANLEAQRDALVADLSYAEARNKELATLHRLITSERDAVRFQRDALAGALREIIEEKDAAFHEAMARAALAKVTP